jgi:hypothetical protein
MTEVSEVRERRGTAFADEGTCGYLKMVRGKAQRCEVVTGDITVP